MHRPERSTGGGAAMAQQHAANRASHLLDRAAPPCESRTALLRSCSTTVRIAHRTSSTVQHHRANRAPRFFDRAAPPCGSRTALLRSCSTTARIAHRTSSIVQHHRADRAPHFFDRAAPPRESRTGLLRSGSGTLRFALRRPVFARSPPHPIPRNWGVSQSDRAPCAATPLVATCCASPVKITNCAIRADFQEKPPASLAARLPPPLRPRSACAPFPSRSPGPSSSSVA